MMTKTTKQRVIEKIITAPKAKVNGRTYNVLPHKAILSLSQSEDSATRRLREMANDWSSVVPAFEIRDEKYLIQPQFVSWLRNR